LKLARCLRYQLDVFKMTFPKKRGFKEDTRAVNTFTDLLVCEVNEELRRLGDFGLDAL